MTTEVETQEEPKGESVGQNLDDFGVGLFPAFEEGAATPRDDGMKETFGPVEENDDDSGDVEYNKDSEGETQPSAGPKHSAQEGDDEGDDDSGEEYSTPYYSPDLLAQARMVGISPKEAESFGSPANLVRVVDRLSAAQPQFQQPQQPAQPPVEAEKQPAPEFQMPELDPNLYDEKFIESVKGMNEFYKAQFDRQQAELQQTKELVQAQQQEREVARLKQAENEFDEVVAALDDKITFGVGTADTMDRHTVQFHNRMQLWQRAHAFNNALTASGSQPLPLSEAVSIAAQSLGSTQKETTGTPAPALGAKPPAGKPSDETARKAVRDALGRFSKKPRSPSKTQVPYGTDRATQAVAELLKSFE